VEKAHIISAVKSELARGESFLESRISYERKLAYDYYYGREFGNEQEGRSRVISADVAQAVDAAVPAIMEIFVAGDQAVEFSPRNAEDVPAAEQATIGANYVFFTQNNGYALAHDFIKDGLLQKTGVFKWKWDTSVSLVEKTYRGLDEGSLQILASNPDVELVGATPYQDPNAMPGPTAQPPAQLYDVTIRRKKEAGKVKITVPPPEEIVISPDASGLDVMEMPFIAHTPLLTESDLVEMGFDPEMVKTLKAGDDDRLDDEKVARSERTDSAAELERGDHNPVYRYNECYIRIDEDGDGIAELRKICMVGDVILHDEPTDHIPLAIWTPKVMPHEVVGISMADDVMDLQLLKSTIWRMTMDSWYQSVFPRLGLAGDVNMDDVLTLKPGAPIRMGPGASITPITVPFSGMTGFQMLEYTDQEKDARVGFSAMGPGLDPDSINKTATFVREMTNQTNARAKLIARNAAEFGFKPLFRGIMYLLSQNQHQALMARVNNKFVPIDPETWSKEYDMTCNVGLGMGSKDQQLMQLQALGMDLQMVGQSPYGPLLLDAKKVYNFIEKKANLAGFKDVTLFLKDPVDPNTGETMQPPEQKDPAIQKAEMQIAADKEKQAAEMQMDGQKMQAEQAADGQKMQQEFALKQQEMMMEMQLKRMEMMMEAKLEEWKIGLMAGVHERVGLAQAAAPRMDSELRNQQ
jgi:hypothetical protein